MFSWLTTRIALYGAGAVVLILVVFLGLAKLGEAAARKEAVGLRADIVTTNQAWGACKSELAQARGEITSQNVKIAEWRQKAQDAQKAGEVRVAAARREAAQYRARARRLAASVPQGTDRCAAASALFVQTISEDRSDAPALH